MQKLKKNHNAATVWALPSFFATEPQCGVKKEGKAQTVADNSDLNNKIALISKP